MKPATPQAENQNVRVTYTLAGTLEYRGRLLKQISTLQAAGIPCRLVYGDRGERPLQREKYDFPIELIPTPRKGNPLAFFLRQMRFGFVAGREIAESDATHVVCFALESLLAGTMAKRRRPNLKLIFDSNELHIESYMNPVKKRLWARVQRFCVPYCDVIMHAEGNRLEYFKKHHDPTDRAQFLLENFPHHISREAIGEKPPHPPLRVLYVGVLGYDRFTRELIDIFRALSPDYALDLVGPISPGYKEEIEGQLRLNPAPNIRILPAIPHGEMSNLIRTYHVGIALYKNNCLGNYYCAPNKVYDYLMNGVPVIANAYPGLLKVLEEGKIGACVKEVDLDNFRAALELINSERRWDNITEEVRHRYSWEAQTPGFLALFR
ncbi:MAG: glycosyltransferase [Verrucomicrobia bacterium]|jgi:glycosyltransferase involved in cell wall biosynthesis|nr:glycosyltransferase [Verrucomicrobiota bacterium]